MKFWTEKEGYIAGDAHHARARSATTREGGDFGQGKQGNSVPYKMPRIKDVEWRFQKFSH